MRIVRDRGADASPTGHNIDTTTQPEAKPRTPRRARRWWQVLVRVAVVVLLILALGYISIPWWAPTGMIKDMIVADLQEQMQVDVEIRDVSLSWSQGVVISGLVFHSPDGFGDAPMLSIDEINCDLSPLSFLLNRRLDWMEIRYLHLNVRTNSSGALNVGAFAKIKPDIDIGRTLLRESTVSVVVPGYVDSPTIFAVHDLQWMRTDDEAIGEIFLTGGLQQRGNNASVNLCISTRGKSRGPSATAEFRFANLNLAEFFPLQSLIDSLPLREVQGLCSGNLSCSIDTNFEIDQVTLQLAAHGLSVQPTGDITLPVIDDAGLNLTATLDSYNRCLNISSLRVRLPGIDLTGRASVHSDILTGDLEAVDALTITGVIRPERILAITTGQTQLVGDLSISGPVRVNLNTKFRDGAFGVDLKLDAAALEIRDATRLIKPVGQQMILDLDGTVQLGAAAQVDLQHCTLKLGQNVVTGRAIWTAPPKPLDPKTALAQQVMDIVAHLQGRGEIEISDLGSLPVLRDGSVSRPRLDGRISGTWSFDNGAGKLPRFDLSLRAGGETQLAVTDSFRKPTGEQFTLDAGVTLDAKTATLTDMLLDLNLAGGRIGIEKASLQFVAPNDPANPDEIRLRGEFNITKLDKLLGCCPDEIKNAAQIDGDISGMFAGQYLRGTTRMMLKANLKNVAVSENEYFVKPAGDNLMLNLGVFSVASKADSIIATLAMETASLQLHLERSQDQHSINIDANFDDFRRVAQSSGFVRRQLQAGDLQGTGQVNINATFDANMNPIELYLRLHSPNLTFVPAGDDAAFAIKHKPVTLLAVNKFESRGDDVVWLSNGRCELKFGKSTGQITYENLLLSPDLTAAIKRDKLIFPLPGTEQLSGTVTGKLDAAELLGDVLAGATQITRAHKLRGTIGISGTFGPTADGEVLLQCEIPTSLTMENYKGYSIPAGASPHLDFTLTAPRDASELYLREFSLNMGDVRVELSGKTVPVFALDGSLESMVPSEFHAAVSADAELLGKMVHELRNAEMTGGLFADVQYKSQGPTAGMATNTTIFANDFRGKFRGKQVRLDGEIFAKNVRFEGDEFVGLDRLTTQHLEFAAGENHGWVIADIANVFANYTPETPAPKGRALVLLEYLDDKDIADWLSTLDAPSPAAAPEKKLEDRAVDVIAQLRDMLQSAELSAHCRAKRLRTFDPILNEHYDVDMLDLAFTAHGGNLRIEYIAGLYGGTVKTSMTTQIRDVQPQVASETEMIEVAATPEIRPQISRIFPGNTVTGMFSRWETVKYPLAEMVCNTLDKSFPLTPEGETKLIAFEGIVIGRAAPKFVTKIFPGLNLSEYKYDKMTSFGQLKGDGSAENETIFSGLYDLYMDGNTDKNNRIKYTIGLVMLGTAITAEWHHNWKQGRFPLLNVSGQIRDGKLVDDVVAYPWPTETFYEMCVRYNIVYRAWINAKKDKEAKAQNN